MAKPDETRSNPSEDVVLKPVVSETLTGDTAEASAMIVESADEKERKRWKRALVVVGSHRLPEDKRPVIVVEERKVTITDTEATADTPFRRDVDITVKKSGYPKGADLYFRTEQDVEMPDGEKDGPTITFGVDVQQGPFHGFSADPRVVHPGPAHPAYAAANIAWQRGAEEIEIIGLTSDEKTKLQPWFDALTGGGSGRDQRRGMAFPADVKITLS